jgi:serine/threonine-protein kinase
VVARRAATIVIGGFLAGYLVTAIAFIAGGPHADVVTVPDVRSLTLARAKRQLERSDLLVRVGDSLPNPRLPRGAVLAQSPLPGQEIAPGTEVRVMLSAGPERRAVPAVAGYARPQAERILTSSGFRVVVVQVADARAAGRVVGTTPAAGATLAMPAGVRLLISAGPPRVAVPSVLGMLQAEAGIVLQQGGLREGEVVFELRPDLAEGVVLEQIPAAGESIPAGRPVRLRVATQQIRTESQPEPVPAADEPPAAPPTLPEQSGSQ